MSRSLSLDEWRSILSYTNVPQKHISVTSTLNPYNEELKSDFNERLKWYKYWQNKDTIMFYLNISALRKEWDIFTYIVDYYMKQKIYKYNTIIHALEISKINMNWNMFYYLINKYLSTDKELYLSLIRLGTNIYLDTEKEEKYISNRYYNNNIYTNIIFILSENYFNQKMIDYSKVNISGTTNLIYRSNPVLLYLLLEQNNIHLKDNPSKSEIQKRIKGDLTFVNKIALSKVYNIPI